MKRIINNKILKKIISPFFFLTLSLIFLREPLFFGLSFSIDNIYKYYPWNFSSPINETINDNSSGTDGNFVFYPRRIYSFTNLKDGKLPLWNPYMLGGMPFLADPHSAIFYPLNLFFILFPPENAFKICAVIQLFFAGYFTFLFLREIKSSYVSSLLGGILFIFNPFFVTHIVNPTNVDSGIWLPLILFMIERGFSRKKFLYSLGIAIPFSMSILGGFPQITVFSTYCFTFYAIFKIISLGLKEGIKKTFKPSFILILGIVIGILLCAIQLIPTYELSLFSKRIDIDYNEFKGIFLSLESLIIFLIPEFFGTITKSFLGAFNSILNTPFSLYSFWRNSFLENNGYIGVYPLIFIIISISLIKKDKNFLFFFSLSLLSLSMMLGFPTFKIFYNLFWGFKFSRICRITYLYGFGIAIISALSFDFIIEKKEKIKKSLRIKLSTWTLIILFIISLFTINFLNSNKINLSYKLEKANLVTPKTGFIEKREVAYQFALKKILENFSRWKKAIFKFFILVSTGFLLIYLYSTNLIRYSVFIFAVFTIITVDLFSYSANYLTFQKDFYPSSIYPSIRFLQNDKDIFRIARYGKFREILPANSPIIYSIQDIEGSNALLPDHFGKIVQLIERESYIGHKKIISLTRVESLNSDILNLLNVKYILTKRYLPVKFYKDHLKLRFDNEIKIYENLNVIKRAFIVPSFEVIENEVEILKKLGEGKINFREKVILQEYPKNIIKLEEIGNSEVKILNYESQYIKILADIDKGGFLVLTDTYFPGWKAFIDGKETKIYRANYAFKAIFVPSGIHSVEFIYKPLSFKIGKIISLTTLFFIVTLGGINLIWRKKS